MDTIKVPSSQIEDSDLEKMDKEVLLYRDNIDKDNAVQLESRDISVKANNGDAAVAMVTSALGLGGTTKVKLPHSGFQIAIPTIDELDKIGILEAINQEIINANINTLGVVNSTSDGVIGEVTASALLKNVISTTLDVPKHEIWKYIDFRDLEHIKAVLGHKLNGDKPYTLEHTCPLCNNVSTIEMEMPELLYYNPDKLTTDQIVQLENKKSNSISVEDVKKYQSMPINDKPTKEAIVTLNGSVTFVINSSNLERYYECTRVWYSAINEAVNSSIVTDTVDESEILRLKQVLARKLFVSSYLPYIQQIRVNTKIISDPNIINRILNNMIKNETYIKPLIEKINDWIKHNTVGFVGIPAFVCDSCNEVIEGDFIKSIIPINASQLFIEVCRVQRSLMLQ